MNPRSPIARHIDLIAIAILLLAVSVFSTARNVVVMTMHGPVRFHMDDGRFVRTPYMPQIPSPPRMPRIPLQRD